MKLKEQIWITRNEGWGLNVEVWHGAKPKVEDGIYCGTPSTRFVVGLCNDMWKEFMHKSLHLSPGEAKRLPKLQPYKPRRGK